MHEPSGGIAHEHPGSLKGVVTPAGIATKLVGGHIVTVRPHSQVRVVPKYCRAFQEGILEPTTHRVPACGDGYALVIRCGGCELRDVPTVCKLIVEHDWVAVVARLAWSAEA